jgi:hypothetical protein
VAMACSTGQLRRRPDGIAEDHSRETVDAAVMLNGPTRLA